MWQDKFYTVAGKQREARKTFILRIFLNKRIKIQSKNEAFFGVGKRL